MIHWFLKKKAFAAKKYIYAFLLIAFSIILFPILKDDPLIESNYTWNDVSMPSNHVEESYQALQKLLWDDRINSKLSGIDLSEAKKNPIKHEKAIEQAWESISVERGIFDRLDSFDAIADLTTVDNVIEAKVFNLSRLSRIYHTYAMLMIETDRADEGARLLTIIYSITRKAHPYARYMINKLIWNGMAHQTIKKVYQLASHPNCDVSTLKTLQKAFMPLTKDHVSCRSASISEYFFMKNQDDNIKSTDDVVDYFCSSMLMDDDSCASTWNRFVLKAFFLFNFKMNRVSNNGVKLFELLLKDLEIYPPDFTRTDDFLNQRNTPELANSGEWLLSELSLFDVTMLPKKIMETKTTSDLLSIYLNERLGKKIKLKDYITGNELIKTDSPGVYFSPGFDGIPGTDDDVRLTERCPN